MTDRVVRDELLESDRYNADLKRASKKFADLPHDATTAIANMARCCYLALLLSCDGFGNFIASTTRLTKLWHAYGVTDDEHVALVLNLLFAVDLARPYAVADDQGRQVRYVHIPRTRWPPRYVKKRKFPNSPWDEKPKNQDSADHSHGARTVRTTRARPGMVRFGMVRKESGATHNPVDKSDKTLNGSEKQADIRPKVKGKVGVTLEQAAAAIGLHAHPGESREAFADRVHKAKAALRRKPLTESKDTR